MFEQDLNQTFGFDNSITGNNNNIDNDMNVDINLNTGNNMMPGQGCCSNNMNNDGIHQRVVNRTFVHDVPHTCPIHTRIINHHIYRHTYRPVYTYSEENTVNNIQCGSCNQFR